MTYAVTCHECDETVWPPAEAEGPGGASEIAALRLALEHARETDHTDVDVVPGCYYVGDGERPVGFGEGVSTDECVTPDRGELVDDIAFAVRSLHSEADRFDEWAGDDVEHAALEAEILADHLRGRADLLERKQRERTV